MIYINICLQQLTNDLYVTALCSPDQAFPL